MSWTNNEDGCCCGTGEGCIVHDEIAMRLWGPKAQTAAAAPTLPINEAVKALRASTGDSQRAFATRLGISIRAVVYYESNRIPDLETLAKLSHLAIKYRNLDLAALFWNALPGPLKHPPKLRQAAVASTDPAPEIPAPATAQPETNRRSGPRRKSR